jgi:RecB family endonuclease NucS
MGYLIKIQNNKAQKLISRAFENEANLQEQVKRYPQIIPLEELDENYKPLLIIGREFPLKNAGSIDLLGIDVDGLITLLEFKLEKNTDMRKVVAQTIEYAANL